MDLKECQSVTAITGVAFLNHWPPPLWLHKLCNHMTVVRLHLGLSTRRVTRQVSLSAWMSPHEPWKAADR